MTVQTERQARAFDRMIRSNENRELIKSVNQQSDLEETPRSLLSARDFYRQLAADIRKAGLVGERRNALATWAIMTSRVLESPLNVIVKGGSSAGKNYLIKTVGKLVPPAEIVRASSLSKHALNYMGEDALKHKIFYIDELSSMTHPARQLISEGQIIHYVTAMKNGERVTKQVVAEGPVACVTTTTRNVLQVDDESRNFSLWINQSHELTKAIGREYVKPNRESLSPERLALWHGVQRRIARVSNLEVRAPAWFEDIVEKVLPYGDLRIRRYWPAFVELCKLFRIIREAGYPTSKDQKLRVTVEFDDFAVANYIFDQIISNSLNRSGSDEDLATADLVATLSNEAVSGSVSASDLVGQPGIRTLDRAYMLLRRAEQAGTIFQSNFPRKNNEKNYRRTPEVSQFLGPAEQVVKKIGLKISGSFMDPIHGKWVYYGDK
jgi:hypothetical protein